MKTKNEKLKLFGRTGRRTQEITEEGFYVQWEFSLPGVWRIVLSQEPVDGWGLEVFGASKLTPAPWDRIARYNYGVLLLMPDLKKIESLVRIEIADQMAKLKRVEAAFEPSEKPPSKRECPACGYDITPV